MADDPNDAGWLPDAGLSLDAALAATRRALTSVSGPEAALDARILLEAATGFDRMGLLRHGARSLGPEAASRLAAFIKRRRDGEPVWRILGEREFWGLPFATSPAVLDPRPDTETLVRAALDALADRRDAPLAMLDLGTGSGAILVSLLHALPRATGWAVDRSEAACRVARSNADRHGQQTRALVLVGDWSTALAPETFDLVVSNPPYIESAVIPTLPREVRDHDPWAALDGGPDGLACYRVIAADIFRLLRSGGVAALEIGAGQVGRVLALMAAAGLVGLETRRDLGGHERVVMGRKP